MSTFKKLTFLVLLFLSIQTNAALPARVLVGYWHTWTQSGIPFIPLSNVDSRYNVINISFVIGGIGGGNVNNLQLSALYTAGGYSKAQLIADIAAARTAGKIINLSIGGATGSFRLTSTADKNTFVTKMKDLIQEYGVDGIDADLEQSAYVCMSGTISNPTDPHTTNMILGIQELLSWYQTTYGRKMVLTMAPETTYTTGGLSSYQVNNICGGSYLPIIEALRDVIDLMMVQLYNSGGMFDLDYVERFQGTVDFVISQTEAMIRGFNMAVGKGTYSGLPASKVVVALPSCANAGSGAMSTANVKSAIEYLMGNGTKPGTYTLKQAGGYPDLRGMMTWSINNDNTKCGTASAGSYEFAGNYQTIFGSLANVNPTITFANVNKQVGDPNFIMSASSNSPGAITYSITTGNAYATINSSTGQVSILGAGTVTVQASQSASSGFNAKVVTATLTISGSTTALMDEEFYSGMSITPTFVHDVATLQWKQQNGNELQISVSDLQGRILFTTTANSNSDKLELNLSGFEKGLYLVHVFQSNRYKTLKVVKQ